MPIDYAKYPDNWKDEIRPDILKREGYKCKFCGVRHKATGYRDGNSEFVDCDKFLINWANANGKKIIRIILTIAHLDHDVINNDYSNLAALCQQCHNRYDAANRAKSRLYNRRKKSDSTGNA